MKHRIDLFYHCSLGSASKFNFQIYWQCSNKTGGTFSGECSGHSNPSKRGSVIHFCNLAFQRMLYEWNHIVWNNFELFCIILWRCIQVVCTKFGILVFMFSEYSMVWMSWFVEPLIHWRTSGLFPFGVIMKKML